jgi:hypothetical protein
MKQVKIMDNTEQDNQSGKALFTLLELKDNGSMYILFLDEQSDIEHADIASINKYYVESLSRTRVAVVRTESK